MTAAAVQGSISGQALAAFKELYRIARQTAGTENPAVKRLRFGPVAVDLTISAGRFADLVLPAIEHAETGPAPDAADSEPADIAVAALDFDGPGPRPYRRLESLLPGDDTFSYLTGAGYHALWQADSRTLETLRSDDGGALYLTGSSADIATWELAAPLRRLIHWRSLDAPRLIVHGAALRFDGIGLLLTGLSGSGKSTTTARALDSGLESAGDDMVLVDLAGPKPVAHALFDVVKIDTKAREGLGFVDWVEWRDIDIGTGKKRCPISAIRPGAFVRSMEIDAILMPTITGGEESRIVPVRAIEVARAMAPSTMQILRGGERKTLAKMAQLAHRADCHRLMLGTDAREVAECLKHFCGERAG